MSDPTKLFKPYRTGAEPSSDADKANVHMTHSGWVRKVTATSPWGGCDDVDADPEILVAFRGAGVQGWFSYVYWNASSYSAAAHPVIEVHVHFSENVTITGTPFITITNNQAGSGTLASINAAYTASGSSTNWKRFITADPTLNQFKVNDVLLIGANALDLNGGTIKDTSDGTTNTIITAASDVGYQGTSHQNGNLNAAGGTTGALSRLKVTT